MVDGSLSDWAQFEDYLYRIIRRNFPEKDGWTIEMYKELSDGSIADYVVYRGNERTIIDAKDKLRLTYEDVDQVEHYRQLYRAQQSILYIAFDSEVSQSLSEYANNLGVTIRRTRWRAN